MRVKNNNCYILVIFAKFSKCQKTFRLTAIKFKDGRQQWDFEMRSFRVFSCLSTVGIYLKVTTFQKMHSRKHPKTIVSYNGISTLFLLFYMLSQQGHFAENRDYFQSVHQEKTSFWVSLNQSRILVGSWILMDQQIQKTKSPEIVNFLCSTTSIIRAIRFRVCANVLLRQQSNYFVIIKSADIYNSSRRNVIISCWQEMV